jgi:Fusaric acid resistance protein-like
LTELREAVVAMAATLAGFVLARLVEVHAHQDVDLGILAVFLAIALARTERARRSTSLLRTAAVLAMSAAAASEVGHLMSQSDDLGDVLFVVTLGSAVWLRRFGASWGKVGSVLTMPFVAALVTPYAPHAGVERDAWSAAIAVLVLGCVVIAEAVAQRTGLVARPEPEPEPEPAPAPEPEPEPPRPEPEAEPEPEPPRPEPETEPTRPRLAPSTRMAAQMAVALAAAFVVGRNGYPDHWSWPVLTAFIVGSGNRGRADVLYKSVLRTAGAVIGTAAATGLSGQFAAGDKWSVALIFGVLGIGYWLRSFNYAYWAACMTGALALLYGYFGQSGGDLLEQRLQGIVAGAACGLAAAWIVLPVRSADVVRRRTSNLLGSLADLLTAVRDQPSQVDRRRAVEVIVAIGALDQVAAPLRARRSLARRWRSAGWAADVIDAAHTCDTPVRTIVRHAAQHSRALTDPHVVELNKVALDNVLAVSEAIRAQSTPELRPLPEWTSRPSANGSTAPESELEPVGEAIVAVNGAVATIAEHVAHSRGGRRR